MDITPANAPRGSPPSGRVLALIGAILILGAAAVWAGMSMLGSDDADDPEPVAVGAASPGAGQQQKERFIARGDALCSRSNRRQEALLFPDTQADFADYLKKGRAILVSLIDDLKKLPRPKEDRALLGKMFAEVDKLPRVLSEAQAAAAAGDFAAVERIVARGEQIEHRANALALRYGFAECSQP